MARRTSFLALALTLSLPVLAQEEDPPAVKARVAELCERVEALRGLEFKEDVKVGIMGTEELREFIAGELDRELPEEDMEALRLAMIALGLLPDGVDLRELLISIYTDEIAGFYDPRTKRLYLVKGNGTDEALVEALGADEEVWIHELTHALDDQHFDFETMYEQVKDHDDASLAQSILSEGVATFTMFDQVLSAVPASADLDLPLEALTGVLRLSEVAANEEETESDPGVRRFKEFYLGAMIAPYRDGLRFVRALTRAGATKWEAVDQAYRDPPASTEQVLHPEKYIAGEAPEEVELPDVAGEMGEGWRLVETNHMGELQIRLWLRLALGKTALEEGLQSALHRLLGARTDFLGDLYRERMSGVNPVEMAAGWAGDTYRCYAKEGEAPALVWRTRWDTETDAEHFAGGANAAVVSFGLGLCSVERSGRTVDVLLGVPSGSVDALEEALAAGR